MYTQYAVVANSTRWRWVCRWAAISLLLCGNGFADALVPDAGALRLAIEDLYAAFPAEYVRGPAYLQTLEKCVQAEDADGLRKLQRDALLDNPLLRQFDRLLLIKRGERQLGLPQNWEGIQRRVLSTSTFSS